MNSPLRKLRCFLIGHDTVVWQHLRPWSRRIVCLDCGGDWGEHDAHGRVRWTPDMQAMYEAQGIKILPRASSPTDAQ
jgi:hypothetical protein